ncbi:MAG: hypothetical protein ACOCRZ_06705 [Halothermotrichaceae bacterium]
MLKKISFCLFIFFLLFIQYSSAEEEPTKETSIVLFVLETEDELVKSDPLFELMDMKDYILLPLNRLKTYLNITVRYNSVKDIVTITGRDGEKNIKIDLETGNYINHVEWSDKPALVVQGEFYTAPEVIEYLADVEINWNPRYQELKIKGSHFSQREEHIDQKERDKSDTTAEEQIPITGSDDISLGSIHYKLAYEKKFNKSYENNAGDGILYINGRIGDWAVSSGGQGSYDSLTQTGEINSTFLKAKYNENDMLLILGDSTFELENTAGKNSLRGIYYRYPEYHVNKIIPYTAVMGKGDIDDEVNLYVNGRLLNHIVLEKEEFEFKHIPLTLKRINTIKVEIIDSNNQKREIVKKVLASPKFFEVGTNEIMIVGGKYSNSNNLDSGKLAGLDWNYALDKNKSIDFETAVKKKDESQKICTGSDVGFAVRGDKTALTIDWLVGGEEQNIKSGLESTFLYGYESGYIELLYNYIPEQTALVLQKKAGTTKNITALWEVDEKWTVSTEFEKSNSFLKEKTGKTGGEVTVNYLIDDIGSIAVTGKAYEKDEKIIDDSDSGYKKTKRKEITINSKYNPINFDVDLKLDLFKDDIEFTNSEEPFNYTGYIFNGDLHSKIADDMYLNSNLDLTSIYSKKIVDSGSTNFGSYLKWYPQSNTAVTLGDNVSGDNLEKHGLSINKNEFFANIQHYFNTSQYLYSGLTFTNLTDNDSYLSGDIQYNYFFEEDEGKASLNLGYISPYQNRKEPQWEAHLNLKKYFDNDMGVNLEMERFYNTLYTNEPEYRIALSLDQALAFGESIFQGQRYNDGEHESLVTGKVYLDENGNEKYDPEETAIAGISMSLDGRCTTTNEDGFYRFNYVWPETYQLGLDLDKLDADYNIVTEKQYIKVRENENIEANFGLTMNGTISGHLFIDNNNNGKIDENDEPLQLVGVELDDMRTVYTDKKGMFYLENIPLGEHKLKVIEESLPGNLKISKKEFNIVITKDKLDYKNIKIPLIYNTIQ